MLASQAARLEPLEYAHMELLIVLALFIVLDIAAIRWGRDSRDLGGSFEPWSRSSLEGNGQF